MRILVKILALLLLCCLFAACSMTRVIPEGQSMLKSNDIVFTTSKPDELSDLNKYIKQTPNKGIFGYQFRVALYNTGKGSGKGWDKIAERVGNPPLIFDQGLMDASVKNILNHMQFKGFYNSKVEANFATADKKTKVVYTVTPGKRYLIDSISYSIVDSELRNLVEANKENTLIKVSDYLSADMLDKESERLSKIFRNNGFFGFDKGFFFFTADTLAHNGKSHIDIAIKDYLRSEDEEDSRPHNIFSFDSVFVTSVRSFQQNRNVRIENDSASVFRRDSLLRVWRNQTDTVGYKNINIVKFNPAGDLVRERVLNRLNLITPGSQYDESKVEATYARFSSLNMFSSVNIQQQPLDSSKIKTTIMLQASNLQGFKLNLEGSTNANGLLGISPAVSYFHKNLFRGAELLTVSVMGDFQFKPRTNIHSTELGVNVTLDIPKFIFAPDKWFRSKRIPHTEISASYSYQTRPEYTRNIISGSYNYTWNVHNKLIIKATPLRANIVRIFNMDTTIFSPSDPYMKYAYSDHFDIGVGASLYYVSDPSVKPVNNYFYIRYNLDLSGNALSLLNKSLKQNERGEYLIWNSPYSQYFRTELSAVYTFKFGNNPNNMLAIRALGGIGKGYGNSTTLPLEKRFWGGGAYGMRGWQPRTLGPGSAPRDTSFTIPNQTGEIRLEGNIEYRFPIFSMFNGAVFSDVGNIWTFDRKISSSKEIDKRGVFKFNNFYKHLALDFGVGLRLDLNFALIRLDLGFKTYNPATSKWIGPNRWLRRGNYEFSFGIGYPF